MGDYLNPATTDGLNEITILGLAHIGDAVYELMVRTWLCISGTSTAKRLHSGTVDYVSATAQAGAAGKVIPMLNEEETAVYKRGRNAHVGSIPRNATFEEYHSATGIEAVFGYLYLRGRTERLEELFGEIIRNQ